MNEVNVKIKKLVENAVIPTYAKPGDMGMDLVATRVEYDKSRDCYVYHTGLAFEVPEGYGMLLFPRSSNRNTEAYMTNHVGILDSGYRGELLICYKRRDSTDIIELVNIITHEVLKLRNDIVEISKNIDNTVNINSTYSGEYERNEFDWELDAPYKVGDRVAQLIVVPYPKVMFEEVEELSASERGTGGHGSTGK